MVSNSNTSNSFKSFSIVTPTTKQITFALVDPTKAKDIAEKRTKKEITSESLDLYGRPTYLLDDESVLYVHFVDGYAHLFPNLLAFKECHNTQLYLAFAIKYTPDDDLRCYYFMIKPILVETLLSTTHTIIDSISNNLFVAVRFADQTYAYISKPLMNAGYWFPTLDMLEFFIEDYYSK